MENKIKLKYSENYHIRNLLQKTKIKEIMTKKPVSVRVHTHFSQVPKIFNEHHIRHLPVVGKNKKVVGLITQRDFFKIHPPRKLMNGNWYYDDAELDKIILEHVMTKNPYCMNENECIGEVLVQITSHKYGCVLVVNNKDRLSGIMTQLDILKVAAQIYLE